MYYALYQVLAIQNHCLQGPYILLWKLKSKYITEDQEKHYDKCIHNLCENPEADHLTWMGESSKLLGGWEDYADS